MTMVYETSCHRHVRIGRLDYASCFITALALNSKATVYVSGVRLHHVISYHIEQSHVTTQQLIWPWYTYPGYVLIVILVEIYPTTNELSQKVYGCSHCRTRFRFQDALWSY